jgi:hypothetical protein
VAGGEDLAARGALGELDGAGRGVASTTFMLTLAGGQWTRSSEPDLLHGVSCSSASSCAAVGSYEDTPAEPCTGMLLNSPG